MSFLQFLQKPLYKYIFFFCVWVLLGGVWTYFLLIENHTFADNSVKREDIQQDQTWWKNQKIDETVFSDKKVKEAYKLIVDKYYGFSQKTRSQIEDQFIAALVESLGDKHSSYFTPEKAKEFNEVLSGDFEWIGAVVGLDVRGIKIVKVLDGSPAGKYGLKDGDVIVAVDTKNIVGLSTDDAIKLIRWPRGTPVKISYIRWDNNQEVLVADVIRDVINVPSVSSEMLENSIGYIEIATFGEHTTDEFYKAFNDLVSSGAKGLILDFRNNGGGYLDTAIHLASAVLPENSVVVKIRENDPTKNETLYTDSGTKSNANIPLVVLVNWYSASASEIFAGALKDNDRAIIVWEKTYGKGSVQEPFYLGDGSMVKLTTARWYTPDDISIDEKGIEPDILSFLTDEDYKNQNDVQKKLAEKILQEVFQSTKTNQEIIKEYNNISKSN